ncbi:MAG: stage 0 sporulation family protein [Clostridia bacterium]|nr:stage 0 sporulation family protein [Clostridia bacterium]
MVKIVGIQFQNNGKIHYFDACDLMLKPGDYVVADTAKGLDLGEVVIGIREVEESANAPMRKIVRIATPQDVQHSSENREKEREAYQTCQKKIAEHQLDMKLVSVEYAFDNSKILFYFTANGRVDFRSLVKDLASVFKMRIELRQIGVRDEAKMLGGLGPCGRPICCGAFLDEFQPVSIKMAKEQNLSLNPTKISGVCGRLMCCLKYEQDHYEQTRKKMPKTGREVSTPAGTGIVSDLNILKETVSVRITTGDSSEIKEFPLEDIIRTDAEKTPDKTPPAGKKNRGTAENDSRNGNGERERASGNESGRDNGNGQRETRPDAGPQAHPQEGRKGARKDGQQLGKPVRRENPNRTKEDDVTAEQPAPVPEQKTEAATTRGSWADALQKAMDAIN